MTAKAGLLTTFCLLGMLPIAPSLAGDPPSLSVTAPTTQLSFTFPGTFQLTRYQDHPSLQPAQREALPRVLVLVERPFQTVPAPIVIGSLPTISLDVHLDPVPHLTKSSLNLSFAKPSDVTRCMNCPPTKAPWNIKCFTILFH